jgi:4-hydroxy 2-oxovalerate aldolase
MSTRITVLDVTMRDGSHTVGHQFTREDCRAVVTALAQAGVPIVEVGHGEGLGASCLTYGRARTPDVELIREAVDAVAGTGCEVAAVLIPGIGTVRELDEAVDAGVSLLRVATMCTEADVGIEHLRRARERGARTAGFLMMSHLTTPDGVAEQCKIHADAGADVVYCTDSAGALTPDGVAARVSAMRAAVDGSVQVGFHGHNNLSLGVANSVAAVREGATYVDTALRGLGAGAGNTSTEVFAAVCDKLEWETEIDVMGVANAAEDIVATRLERLPAIDRGSLMLGWAGVPSTFLLHAERAAQRFEVSQAELLLELGRRKMVAGQEDMIVDVAIAMRSFAGREADA